MRRYSKKQLNAISRNYIEKAQKESRAYLESIGINYEDYCKKYGWKASITRLATKFKNERGM